MSSYIKFLKNNLVISVGFILSASSIQAHEFWIEPSDFFLQNENLEAHLNICDAMMQGKLTPLKYRQRSFINYQKRKVKSI